MKYALKLISALYIITTFYSCSNEKKLTPITVAQFSKFVSETNYKTDAEKFGWSIVQETIHKYHIADNTTWKLPNGTDAVTDDMPVTQVSYNDAIAYCNWADVKLPTYNEYWEYVKKDKRKIISNSDKIQKAKVANIVGNTWDITSTTNAKGEVRLAGGSYLCDITTCDGTNPDRNLFVSADTGNTHISFSVFQ